MRTRLEGFEEAIDTYLSVRPPGAIVADGPQRDAMYRAEPTARRIVQALEPALAEQINLDDFAGEVTARNAVRRALGILEDLDEVEANLAPAGPVFAADQLHRWVWDAARTYWESQHFRAACDAAATAINAHTQTKVSRRDVSDRDLMNAVFTERPKPGQVYLRLPGDPADQTVRSRNQALRPYAEGLFAGVRNPAAHEHGDDWDEQLALEYLAALSVLARWIDQCDFFVGE